MKLKDDSFLIAVIVFFLLLFMPCSSLVSQPSIRFIFTGLAFAQESGHDVEPFEVKTEHVPDPLEKWNRAMFTVNDRLYFWVLKPVAIFYSGFVPPGVRQCVRNAYLNFLTPVRFVNCVLQGKFDAAGKEAARLVINSTLGAGGMFDVAKLQFSIPMHDEDLGQTLGKYGMKPVAFLYLPILGPSSIRDGIGTAGDAFLNPLYYIAPDIEVSAGTTGGVMMNNASLRVGEYEDFKKSALDPYISLRDAYLQNRAKEIRE